MTTKDEAERLARRLEQVWDNEGAALIRAQAKEIEQLKGEMADQGPYINKLRDEIEALKQDLQWVERCANHHGQKPHITAVEALGMIQHYPPIKAITKAYSNGKMPTTPDPYAEIEALKDTLRRVYQQQTDDLDDASDAMEFAAKERDGLKAEIEALRKPMTKTRIGNALRSLPNGDITMYRNGFKDGVRFALGEK